MGNVALAARALIALVFAVAAVSKLRDGTTLRAAFQEFGAPARLTRLAGLLVPAELCVAIGLLIAPAARAVAIFAAILLLAFIAGTVHALRLGRHPECNCFGGFRPARIGPFTIARNAVLLAAAVLVTVAGPGRDVGSWLASHSAAEVGLLVVATLAGAAVLVIGFPALERFAGPVDEAALRASAPPEIGTHAPVFSTTDVRGEPRSLEALTDSGRALVLIFGSGGCGSCIALFEHLPTWQETLAERLRIAVIGTGDADLAMLVHEQFGVSEVLLDPSGDLARAYGVRITPTAFSVTPGGELISGPAVGPDAVEDLIRMTLHHAEPALT